MNGLLVILFMLGLICSHELGHFILAKYRGNFKKFGFVPNPCVRLTHPYPSRWDYLSGFLFSLVLWPFWSISFLEFWYLYLVFAVGGSCADFLVVIFYGKVKK